MLALVERGGEVRTLHVDDVKAKTLVPILKANIAREARVMTDEAGQYVHLRNEFAEHGVVSHGKGENVRGEIHTNTLEGYFSIFKRGMKGVYQHCAEKHLHRYLAEFEFRYNNRASRGCDDSTRLIRAMQGVQGKRLTYRRPDEEVA